MGPRPRCRRRHRLPNPGLRGGRPRLRPRPGLPGRRHPRQVPPGPQARRDSHRYRRPAGPRLRPPKGLHLPLRLAMTALSHKTRRAARRHGVRYSFLFMRASGAQLNEITTLIETNILRPILDQAYPFDEAPKPSPTSKAAGPKARSSSPWSDTQRMRMPCNPQPPAPTGGSPRGSPPASTRRTLAVWLDSTLTCCTNSTQAHCVDGRHQPTDLAVGGSNPSRRANLQVRPHIAGLGCPSGWGAVNDLPDSRPGRVALPCRCVHLDRRLGEIGTPTCDGLRPACPGAAEPATLPV